MNSGIKPYSIDIYPYIHNPCNMLSKDMNLLKPIKVPDISTIDVLKANPNLKMRMCSGEFLSVYSGKEYAGYFDCITTCFFIWKTLYTSAIFIEYVKVCKLHLIVVIQ